MASSWLGADCKNCPFAKDGGPPHKPVAGVFPPGAVGLLVSESPGPEEAEQGKPLVGTTGRQLDLELLEAGLARSKLAVLKATGCKPPPTKTEGMVAKAVKCCRPAFIKQLEALPSDIPTFAMGKWAVAALTGTAKGLGNRGFIQDGFKLPRAGRDSEGGSGEVEVGEQVPPVSARKRKSSNQRPEDSGARVGEKAGTLIVTWHPTFAFFRNPYEWGTFTADLRRFARLIRGQLEKMPEKLIITPTLSDIRRIAKEKFVAVDIETAPDYPERPWTGKDPTRAQLKTISLGCETWALAFHWETRRDLWAATKWVLANPNILKVTQNGPYFDRRVLKRYKIVIDPLMDTRDMRRVLVSTSKLSLAYMTSIYTDFPPWKQNEETEEVNK